MRFEPPTVKASFPRSAQISLASDPGLTSSRGQNPFDTPVRSAERVASCTSLTWRYTGTCR